MIMDVVMPNLGLTITEATLLRWLKQPGERIEKGEVLFEIETDKAVQEIESTASGTVLAHLAAEGAVVPLGQPVAKIGTEAADPLDVPGLESGPVMTKCVGADRPVPQASLPFDRLRVGSGSPSVYVAGERERGDQPPKAGLAAAERYFHAGSSDAIQISPRARRAAQRLGIDLASVQPTGARGRHIREKDVLLAAERMAAHDKPEPIPIAAVPQPETATMPDRLRRLTAERTAASFRDTPHFYLTWEVNAERLVVLREEIVADLEGVVAVRVTITDLLVKALALALQAFPALNAQWRDGEIVPLSSVDVGLAVDTSEGLIVPVLRAVDRLTLRELAGQRQALVERAKAGRSRPENLVGGSFTLSNLGPLGVDQFEAIISPPQSGILAVGAIKSRPFVVNEQLTVCKTLFLTLSVDHRVTDGAVAARFLAYLVRLLEKPTLLGVL